LSFVTSSQELDNIVESTNISEVVEEVDKLTVDNVFPRNDDLLYLIIIDIIFIFSVRFIKIDVRVAIRHTFVECDGCLIVEEIVFKATVASSKYLL
jgi:hypothetical protein